MEAGSKEEMTGTCEAMKSLASSRQVYYTKSTRDGKTLGVLTRSDICVEKITLVTI